MKKILLITIFFLFIFLIKTDTTFASTYYISNTGSDSNNGTTTSTPWQTLSKVNAQTFLPGDSILFKKGDTWREQLVFPSSGASGNHITISSYGTGNKPEFTSPQVNASWTSLGSGRYSATVANSTFFWEDYKQVAKATTSVLTDGDWFCSGLTIYYRPSTGIPTDHVLNYSGLSGLGSQFKINDRSYLTISGLQFTYNGIGILVYGNSTTDNNSIIVQNCDFISNWRGFFIQTAVGHNATDITLTNNYFKWCQSSIGIYIADGGNGAVINPIITYNEMDAGGTTDGTTHWNTGQTDFEAIGIQNLTGAQIHHNYIHDGYQIGFEIYNAGASSSSGNHFYNNKIENNHKSVIVFVGDSNSLGFNDNWISYNIFKNAGIARVFDFYQKGSATQMNYFVNNTAYGEYGYFQDNSGWEYPSLYLTIANNIFTEIGSTDIDVETPGITNLVLSNNIYNQVVTTTNPFHFNYSWKNLVETQALGYEINSRIANPLFISSSDFHLQSSSPAINTGVNVGLTSDFEGNPIVGLPDIGTYESNYGTSDSTPPSISSFTIPTTSTSLTISPITLTATDTVGVTGYLLTETGTEPSPSSGSWTSSSPTTYTFSSQGTKTLYAWAKDAAGNVSTSVSDTVVITLPPVTATTFTLTGPSSGNINTASTNFTITPNNTYTGTITITPSGTGSTGLSAITKTFSSSSTPQTFTITPTVTGSTTLTPTNNGGLTNPSSKTYTSNAIVPGAPTSVSATAGNANATVTFSAPSSNGGSTITRYTVTSSPSGGTDVNTGSTSLSHSITGLTNETSYTFTVKATNSVGQSSASTASSVVTPQTNTYTLTIAKAGTGTGTVSGANTYTSGTVVTGTATPSSGSTFTSFGGDCNTSGQVTMTANKVCTATFTIIPVVNNNTGGGGGGGGGGGSSSPTTTNTITEDKAKSKDIKPDGIINIIDFNIIMANWNKTYPTTSSLSKGDMTGDGKIDIFDINQLMVYWGVKYTL